MKKISEWRSTIGKYEFLPTCQFCFFQELENTDQQLNGLRERKAQLEEKMRIMQQTRRQLMQQLEVLMSELNVRICFCIVCV